MKYVCRPGYENRLTCKSAQTQPNPPRRAETFSLHRILGLEIEREIRNDWRDGRFWPPIFSALFRRLRQCTDSRLPPRLRPGTGADLQSYSVPAMRHSALVTIGILNHSCIVTSCRDFECSRYLQFPDDFTAKLSRTERKPEPAPASLPYSDGMHALRTKGPSEFMNNFRERGIELSRFDVRWRHRTPDGFQSANRQHLG